MELQLIRSIYTERATGGDLYCDSLGWLCCSLEDTVRPHGIKVSGSTAIPEGRYKLGVSYSNRFKRDMVMLSNCADGCTLHSGGISFTGVRIHGGNTHEDTSGCILAAANRINDYTIQGTQESMITKMVSDAIKNGEECWLETINE